MTQENSTFNNKKYTLAPIVLFVYNRPNHTKQTLEALKNNVLANKSELFIYSDAAKFEIDQINVFKVREYIRSIHGFKNITIIEREKNWGLANSIIDGVTKIVNEYGKIIVLEDDIVTSPYFLKFMNEALEIYKMEKKVWHISGWNYPIDTDGLDDVFFYRFMNCWGWATWEDRWKHFEKNTDKALAEFTKEAIYRFNLDGAKNFWKQVLENHKNKINTWAIFWYITIFKKNGLCLNPSQTFVVNIGNDSSGIHSSKTNIFTGNLCLSENIKYVYHISENKLALEKITDFYKINIFTRILRKIKSLIN